MDSVGLGLERQLLEGAYAISSKAVLAFGTIDLKPVPSAGQPFFFMGVKGHIIIATSRLPAKLLQYIGLHLDCAQNLEEEHA
jgi:hypothetical protein